MVFSETAKMCFHNFMLAILFFAGGAVVHAQFIPPPPIKDFAQADVSFSSADRAKLEAVYWNTKAIRAKLFTKVIDGTQFPDPN